MQGGGPARDDQTGIALIPRRRTLTSTRTKGKRWSHVDNVQNARSKQELMFVNLMAGGYQGLLKQKRVKNADEVKT